ncbi:MAG: hypothetical protein AB1482_13255 [Pseudomonadota bacterium]
MLQRTITILWPSFLVAGVADVIFTTLFDPLELMYRGEALIEHRVAAYTIGFFVFWLICISSSMLTCYFQRSADEINRCPLPAPKRPEGCPKREDESDCC